DARWVMAYAAALGETGPDFLDTLRPGGLVVHPLFPVCYEWPPAVELRARLYSDALAAQSVHATHDLHLHRAPRAGDRLRTTARVVLAEPRRPGAYVVTRMETVDADGAPVSTTDYGSIFRGVDCGAGRRLADLPSPPDLAAAAGAAWDETLTVAPELSHTYTECARIWNPIHTDRAVAVSAGLPGIILHGTATLALAVSRALRRAPAGQVPRRIVARFAGMVPLPSTLTVEGGGTIPASEGTWTAFRARGADGAVVLRDAAVLTMAERTRS